MTSVGETLRRERLQRNLDLDQISRELKISRRLARRHRRPTSYEQLPGGVFAKAFVRQYAALLGLDGEELAAQVQQALSSRRRIESRRTARPKPAVTPIEVPRVEEWKSVGDQALPARPARCRPRSWWWW